MTAWWCQITQSDAHSLLSSCAWRDISELEHSFRITRQNSRTWRILRAPTVHQWCLFSSTTCTDMTSDLHVNGRPGESSQCISHRPLGLLCSANLSFVCQEADFNIGQIELYFQSVLRNRYREGSWNMVMFYIIYTSKKIRTQMISTGSIKKPSVISESWSFPMSSFYLKGLAN